MKREGAGADCNFCARRDCVFHAEAPSDACILPSNKNFFVLDSDGWVRSCANHFTQLNDLSNEGLERLKAYGG